MHLDMVLPQYEDDFAEIWAEKRIFKETMEAHCNTCDTVQPCELSDEGGVYYCSACGDEVSVAPRGSDKYSGYKVGRVINIELIPKQKDLKKVLVDVGEGKELPIVTNAKYVEVGWLVVVAMQGAIVPAGASLEDDPEAIQVTKRSVGGIMSFGMLCDSPMLDWAGGAKGAIQRLPDAFFVVGESPPLQRPR